MEYHVGKEYKNLNITFGELQGSIILKDGMKIDIQEEWYDDEMEIFNFKTEQHGNMLVLNFKGWDNYGVVLVIDLKSEKQILMDHGELSVVVCQDGGCLSID